MRDSELIRQVWAHGSLTWRDSKRSHRDETRVNFSRTLKRTSVNGSGFALLIWKPFLIFRPLLVGNCTWRHHILTTCALTLQPWTMSAESSPEPWMGHQPCVHACWAHAFQTSTTPLSPSKSGCSARAWTQGTSVSHQPSAFTTNLTQGSRESSGFAPEASVQVPREHRSTGENLYPCQDKE